MSQYKLINPHIEGDFIQTYNGKTSLLAAQSFWNSFSKYITNNLPKFAFTLERVSDGKLLNFLVKESGSDKLTDFTITQLKNVNASRTKKRLSRLQSGGFDDDDSSSSSSSSDEDDSSSSSSDNDSTSDIYKKIKRKKVQHLPQPIRVFVYDPVVYGETKVFIPTFTIPLTPYISIKID